MTDEKKFDPSKELPRADRDYSGKDATDVPLEAWVWHTTMEQLEAIEYVIGYGKGLGYQSVDEFVREAVRDKLAALNKAFTNERIREDFK